jgi:hypothetical protein
MKPESFSALVIHYLVFGGLVPTSIEDFIRQILTTSQGWTLIIAAAVSASSSRWWCRHQRRCRSDPRPQCRGQTAIRRPSGCSGPIEPHADVGAIVAGSR